MHGFFAAAGVAASILVVVALGGCSGGGNRAGTSSPASGPHGSEAAPGTAPIDAPVPKDCDAQAAAVKAARASGGDAEALPRAVFAQAECEQARLGAAALDGKSRDDFEQRLAGAVALYGEVAESAELRWQIGGALRLGDLYRMAAGKARKASMRAEADAWLAQARAAYTSGLRAADSAPKDLRLDVEVSDWIKAGCTGATESGANPKAFKVCRPWKDGWR